MKVFSYIFIIAGLGLLLFGGYQYWQTQSAQKASLTSAYELLKTSETADNVRPTIDDFNPEVGETVGILSIPAIHAELPIVEGTDEDELEKGVGHYKGTAWPTQNDQIVLSGHRDTVFRRMGDLEIGDQFIIKLPYGEFAYEIEGTKIVDADDRTIIGSTAPDEVLVVTTCYPFSYVGSAPDRYIIYAKPID
ncbi:class D sortase [Alkalihalobacterium chitinilyticum]|uniref:Class D sortase n=1 Tax=Alkalihalobacterium chitinilyticum TaxID=2980103 RepID=A0ABT5VHV9_9BACI|nr:class D sortase [Alkalihalobacterium chitinilyticum]MDE5413819.1 class D sortase [Alkalihalobacterium chitinilyticum]